METVDTRVIEIALSRVSGHDFENFAQGFFASTLGVDYVPMGGSHDGGADGAFSNKTFEIAETQKFLQASVTADPKTKIRQTIRRLREFGRKPSRLIYATNQKLALLDQLEESMSEEMQCSVVIRDGNYFQHQINGSPGSLQAYKTYVHGAASFLDHIGSADTVQSVDGLPAKTLCVFIGQELDQRRGKTELLESVTDSLILWSLEETDPDKNAFLTIEEIKTRVIETLPSAKMFFKGVLKNRLNNLVSKGDGGARKINFHKKKQGYCLPYETRKRIREENIEDENLLLQVSDVFRTRALEYFSTQPDNHRIIQPCVEVCHDVVHKSFHAQGLEMAVFVESEEGADFDMPSIANLIDQCVHGRGLTGEDAGLIVQGCISVLKGTYYSSTKTERRYLRKLSRTYILLFMLKNEPRVVEYFRNMTSDFNLYVGADLIVRCLSEHLLKPQDQMTKNALKLLKASGSKLILTDKTLDEVWHHFKTTHWEFINNYQEIQDYMTPLLASQIEKILIRAFFYSKLEKSQKGGAFSWQRFIGQFMTVAEISSTSARDELREYLINEFDFVFEDEDTLLLGIDPKELEELTKSIKNKRNKIGRDDDTEEILSRNSALTVLKIYERRVANGERSGGNPYGFKTWWLTQQTRVQNATKSLVSKHSGRYMMRPEFILHFLAAIPSSKEVQDSYDQIFPSMLGVKLANRMDETAFKKIIGKAKAAYDEVDESRTKVLLAKASAKLQSDFLKGY